MPEYAADALRTFQIAAFSSLGVSPDDARLTADYLITADMLGHASHGVMRAPWYCTNMKNGVLNATATPDIIADLGALALIDGGDGLGQVIATKAMQEAIDRADKHGIGAIAVRNSGHFGMALTYTEMAAMAGCVGFMSTNAAAAMAAWGGVEKRIGNNPFSIAAPAGKNGVMALDLALTAVARGKIFVAQRKGETIPDTWATDSEGNPTTDPAIALAGNLLPIGEHKGYGLAVMIDVLSGVLSGSQFATGVKPPFNHEERSGAGHFCFAIKIDKLRPLAEFEADMERLVDILKSTPKRAGVSEIFFPGELEQIRAQQTAGAPIDLPDATVASLNELATDLGIAPLSH